MKPHPLRWFALIPFLSLLVIKAEASYLLPPSTGTDVPYSIQTKTLLKGLFNNANVAGGQVVALKDQPGRHFSGNYIDVGDLAGVKKGDVFALFSPKGDPVGLIRVTLVQRFVSAFEFIELTVDPSENLIAKRVTEEVKGRLPERLRIVPDMGKFKRSVVASKGSIKAKAGQSLLPPLPGDSSSSTLPALPGEGTGTLPALPGEATGDLPPAPEMDMGPMGSGLPPLPMDGEALPSGDGGLPPLPDASADGGLPPLDGDSSLPPLDPSAGLPPGDPGMSDLPPMPDQGMPALPGDGFSDPAATGLPPLNDPGLPPLEGGADGGLPPLPSSDLPQDGSLPPLGMDDSLPPLSDPGSLPPSSDSSLPPIPGPETGASDPNGLPPFSDLPDAPTPMTGLSPFSSSDMSLPPSSSDASLPPLGDDSSLAPPPAVADLPGSDLGLPPAMDGSLPPVEDPMMPVASLPGIDSDASLPPSIDDSLPPSSDLALPGSGLPSTDLASLPPEPAGLPPMDGMDDLPPPSLDAPGAGLPSLASSPSMGSSDLPGMDDLPPSLEAPSPILSPAGNGHAAQLGLPALPTGVRGGFLQDLPTLAGG
jgi:hypothetical protein